MIEITKEQLLKLSNKNKAKVLKLIAMGIVKFKGE